MRALASVAVTILIALSITPAAAAIPVEAFRSAPVAMGDCSGSGVQAGSDNSLGIVAEDCGDIETTPAGSGSSGGREEDRLSQGERQDDVQVRERYVDW